MIKKILFYSFIALTFVNCTNTEYKEGLSISKFDGTTIYTTDGSEIPLRPKGFEESSTVILVRHAEAEQVDGETNPTLTKAGFDRAAQLGELLEPIGIDAYAMSDLKRTIFTARPLAEATDNYSPKIYNVDKIERLTPWILEENLGKNLVVFGHSNTTPMVINNITGKGTATDIPHDEYDNLYIVNTLGEGKESVVYQFKY